MIVMTIVQHREVIEDFKKTVFSPDYDPNAVIGMSSASKRTRPEDGDGSHSEEPSKKRRFNPEGLTDDDFKSEEKLKKMTIPILKGLFLSLSPFSFFDPF